MGSKNMFIGGKIVMSSKNIFIVLASAIMYMMAGCARKETRAVVIVPRFEYREAWKCAAFVGPVNNPCGGMYGKISVVAHRGSIWHAPIKCCGFVSDGARCDAPRGCD